MPILFNAYDSTSGTLARPLELATFLRGRRKMLKNRRLLYLVAARQDNEDGGSRPIDDAAGKLCVLKVGISVHGDPTDRLREYVRSYGEPSRRFPCRGVYLYFCMTTPWREDDRIPRIGTLVYKLEQAFISAFPKVRGRERIRANPRAACHFLSTEVFSEATPRLRVSPRRQVTLPKLNRWIYFLWEHFDGVPPDWYLGKVVRKTTTTVHVDYKDRRTGKNNDVHRQPNGSFIYGPSGTWVYENEINRVSR